jgi:hypothetical protein
MFSRFAAACVVSAVLVTPALACDQNQAVDKMTKLATALGQKASQATTNEDSQKIVAANQKLNEGGQALGAGDYDKACQIYDEVAKENGIAL